MLKVNVVGKDRKVPLPDTVSVACIVNVYVPATSGVPEMEVDEMVISVGTVPLTNEYVTPPCALAIGKPERYGVLVWVVIMVVVKEGKL